MDYMFIGPRFVLNLIKIFEGSFGGATLYENPSYITPNAVSYDHFNRVSSHYIFVLLLFKKASG